MNYCKKAANWCKNLKEKEDSDIEYLVISADSCLHTDKDRTIQPDFVYYQVQKKGKKEAEFSWKKECGEKPAQPARFVMKGRKKLICILGEEDAYGFGFDTKEEQSILLYMRIGCAAILMYTDTANGTISVMYGIESENPERMDCLKEFVRKKEGCIEYKNLESEECC